MSKDENKDV